MGLFSFGRKNAADSGKEDSQERSYFKAKSAEPQAEAATGEQKDMLRLIALDACRKVDLEQAVRSCQVASNGRGFSLLLKMHEHANLTEAQVIKRTQAFERRCSVVADSRGLILMDVYWSLPVSFLSPSQERAAAGVSGGESVFAVSQMADFAPSQLGGGAAYYPDASLVPWDASDLPELGEVRKAPPGPAAGRRRPRGESQHHSQLGFSDE